MINSTSDDSNNFFFENQIDLLTWLTSTQDYVYEKTLFDIEGKRTKTILLS